MPDRRISENVLENALENVKFSADNTWSCSELQKTNQELLKQTEELEHTVRKSFKARNVRDSIPKSRLAGYANYEYDESRELCYASSISDVSFYYPCVYKRNCIVEPWMLPEVEQMFIWLTYSADFSLLEPLSIEELERVDDEEAAESENHCSGGAIFHEIKPLIYENVERTPGKSRYTQCCNSSSENTESSSERKQENMDLQMLMLENRVKCENVRKLWYDSTNPCDLTVEEKVAETEDKLNVFRSPLGNYFTFENAKNMRNIPKVFKIDDNETNSQKNSQESNLDSLKTLTNSLVSLEENLLGHTYSKKKFTQFKENSGRRLYSAVVQGVPSKPLVLARVNESTNTLSLANLRSVVALDEIGEQQIAPQKFPVQLNVCQQRCQMDVLLKKTKECGKMSDNDVHINTFTSSTSPHGVLTPSTSSFFSGNTSITVPSPPHLLMNNYNTSNNCLMNICGNTYLHNYSNPFTPNQTPTQNTRQSFTNNLVSHQPLWLFHQQQQQQQQQQLRQQSYYSTANCHGFMYVPSPIRTRNPQRWPPFFKPLTSCVPSSNNIPSFQTWGQTPCTYKANSTQYFNSKQCTDVSRLKSRQHLHPLKMDRNNKSSVDDSKKESSTRNSSFSSDNPIHATSATTRIRYFYRSGGVNSSFGDELERQAIEQYQPSDENFCRELEQQAIEQYENSENRISPSNKLLLFGGLIYKYILSALYRQFVIFTVVVTY